MDHAKFWFHRRRLTTEAAALGALVALFLSAATGQPDSSGGSEPSAAGEPSHALPAAFNHFLASVGSFRARFVQELWSDDQRLIEVAQGNVELLRPGRFRWHYDQPYEQLIVADGETLWMYDVDISQVTRSTLSANDAGNPGALLSGDSDVLDSFVVLESGSDDGNIWVSLAPRVAQGDYSRVRVAFAGQGSDSVLTELEFVDGLDQTTVIHFLDAEVNPAIEPQRFEFEIPDNAHVLGGPG
ncbi:MAG: outer membrane lipoprotein chaperone LolA [Gammaproteobacteria bacterium]|jgi:outer membrane lipoprotein carrier protein